MTPYGSARATNKGTGSIVRTAYEHDVPIFCPAFSDCSAGFGLVAHQHARGDQPKVSIDSVKDFYELTPLKLACRERCRELVRSGGRFGVYCVGSSAGLMLAVLALGVMNVALMVGVAAIVLAQKLLPPQPLLDASLALAIVAFGVLVVAAPSTFAV